MLPPRAVVIPFGVPEGCRGLGLGLAALIHGFATVQGGSVALAQLHSRAQKEGDVPAPIEAFVSPETWRDLSGSDRAPLDVDIIITGTLEPPADGRGLIQLMAFHPERTAPHAVLEAPVDMLGAGASIRDAMNELLSKLGGGIVADLSGLDWESLESLLRAERCVLHDPRRGGPHDELAALLHLERAIEETPTSRFAIGRLAAVALFFGMDAGQDERTRRAALRALARASEDAPDEVDLLEARAALHIRLGEPEVAETLIRLSKAPESPRRAMLLSESLRAQKKPADAARVIAAGLSVFPGHMLLEAERGATLLELGREDEACACLKAMVSATLHPPAFFLLMNFAREKKDATLASFLVDAALVGEHPTPDLLRQAIELLYVAEPSGTARSVRTRRLAERILEMAPEEPWATLTVARTKREEGLLGEATHLAARAREAARGSEIAMLVARFQFELEAPEAFEETELLLARAHTVSSEALVSVRTQARALSLVHDTWPVWFLVGVVEQKLGHVRAAKAAFLRALALCPECTFAHEALSQLAPEEPPHAEPLTGLRRFWSKLTRRG